MKCSKIWLRKAILASPQRHQQQSLGNFILRYTLQRSAGTGEDLPTTISFISICTGCSDTEWQTRRTTCCCFNEKFNHTCSCVNSWAQSIAEWRWLWSIHNPFGSRGFILGRKRMVTVMHPSLLILSRTHFAVLSTNFLAGEVVAIATTPTVLELLAGIIFQIVVVARSVVSAVSLVRFQKANVYKEVAREMNIRRNKQTKTKDNLQRCCLSHLGYGTLNNHSRMLLWCQSGWHCHHSRCR